MKRQRRSSSTSSLTTTATNISKNRIKKRRSSTTVQQFFICKDIIAIIVCVVLKTSTPTAWLSLLLVCKDWNNILNSSAFWKELFMEKFSERTTLIGVKYRSNPAIFGTFSYLQRWACLTQRIPINNNALTKYGYFTESNYNGQIILTEGRLFNGHLEQGVCYVVDSEIQEGDFNSQGQFVSGEFDVWNPSVDGWTRFVGVCNPQNGWRDEGTAFWPDGSSYFGQFKRNYRHGIGYMSNAKGEITCSGVWKKDVLVIPDDLDYYNNL